MKYYRYYLYSSVGLILLFALMAVVTTNTLVRLSMETSLSEGIEAARQEAKIISSLSEGITNKSDKKNLQNRIQKSISFSESQTIFNSVIDWSGKYICYPDKKEVGQSSNQNQALTSIAANELTAPLLFNFVFNTESTNTSEIILLTPIKDSDWLVASHINKNKVIEKASNLEQKMLLAFFIIALIIIIFVLAILRILSGHYQKQLAAKSSKFEDGVLNLSKLNASLDNYQKSLLEFKAEQTQKNQLEGEENVTIEETKDTSKNTKQRILTYVRNEILSVSTEDISHIYVDNTITYVVRKDGKRSTTGDSLDLIYSSLDERFFFRVNRQIIVAISAIETITKFGNSKLKIQVKPTSEVDIIIGKNKAAAFKQWLDL